MAYLLPVINFLIIVEFIYIFYLETIATNSAKTAKVFGLTPEVLGNKNMQNALKNQGVYNLGIAILLFLATFVFRTEWVVIALQLYIVGVALYGAVTVSFSILFKQGGLAILALVLNIATGFN